MIRLPLTSISLSKTDVETHLRDINTYQSLRNQGFKKKEISQYQKSKQHHDGANNFLPLNTAGLEHLDTVTLACQHLARDSSPDKSQTHDAQQRTEPSLCAVSISDGPCEEQTSCHQQQRDKRVNSDTTSPSFEILEAAEDVKSRSIAAGDDQPMRATRRYAPRQTSLLRYAKHLSPENEDVGNPTKVLLSSETSCQQVDESSRGDALEITRHQDTPIDELKQLMLDEPSVTSVRQKGTCHGNGSSPAPESMAEMPELLSLTPPTFNPSKVDRAHQRGSDGGHSSGPGARTCSMDAVMNFPSSPPPPALERGQTTTSRYINQRTPRSGSAADRDDDISPFSERAHGTRRWGERNPRSSTDPGHHRHHFVNGSTFMVYDDSLPTHTQPQMPAELYQHSTLNDASISYVVRPGVMPHILTGSEQRSQAYGPGPHNLSPTVRAIDMRSRRNREYRRSVAVEELRLIRSRRISQIGGDQVATHPGETMEMTREEYGELWRDELDADRVGEENFDMLDGDNQLSILDSDVIADFGRDRRNQVG